MAEYNFIHLKKNCRKDATQFPLYKLAVLGDCATQHIATALQGYAFEEMIQLQVYDADYNQIDAQLLDLQSELYSFEANAVLLYLCVEKMYDSFCKTDEKNRILFAENMIARIQGYWDLLNQNSKVNILQYTFAEFDDGVFGNFAAKNRVSFLYQIKKLNLLLMEKAQEYKNVFLVDLNGIQAEYGRVHLYDAKMYDIAKMPLSMELLPEAAKQTVDVIKVLMGKIKKCVIMDLDHTLWGGVIGDDGLEGIQIGELGIGHAFEELQTWLKELKNRGIILAVCSKNDEEKAKEPFLKHPDMVLRLEDISMFVANWEDKASNIKRIQETINIGMDSVVFLDDNPFERNLVRQMIPDITVPELPEDPAEYLHYLRNLNLFETISYSEADKDRTRQYQAEVGRKVTQQQYATYEEYLESLEMQAMAKFFEPFQYPRIAQLTQRSNQFNLRTIRYTEADIERIANDERYITRYYTLKDKFGEHGLISVVIMEKREQELFIDTWLMSCRVLKRGMEEFIINDIVAFAKDMGYNKVIGEYIKTQKNGMVETIYERMQFVPLGDGLYELNPEQYSLQKTAIAYADERS